VYMCPSKELKFFSPAFSRHSPSGSMWLEPAPQVVLLGWLVVKAVFPICHSTKSWVNYQEHSQWVQSRHHHPWVSACGSHCRTCSQRSQGSSDNTLRCTVNPVRKGKGSIAGRNLVASIPRTSHEVKHPFQWCILLRVLLSVSSHPLGPGRTDGEVEQSSPTTRVDRDFVLYAEMKRWRWENKRRNYGGQQVIENKHSDDSIDSRDMIAILLVMTSIDLLGGWCFLLKFGSFFLVVICFDGPGRSNNVLRLQRIESCGCCVQRIKNHCLIQLLASSWWRTFTLALACTWWD
jgi:hypothetical protein